MNICKILTHVKLHRYKYIFEQGFIISKGNVTNIYATVFTQGNANIRRTLGSIQVCVRMHSIIRVYT